jgi:hypothetical protein
MRRATRIPKSATNGHLLLRPAGQQFWRQASCAEVECAGYVHGFSLRVDEGTELGRAQAAYLRSDRSRRGAEHRDEVGLTVFSFSPGQRCTSDTDDQHRVALEREPLYVLRNARGKREVTPTQWTDTLHEATDQLATLRARG